MPRIAVRRATLRDLPTLVAHRRGMFVDMREGFTKRELDEADVAYARWARPRIKNGSLVGLVAESEGEPIGSGCVWLQPVQPRPGRAEGIQPYLMSMFTEPKWRGRGVARRIVRAATKWARDEGHPRLTLHASDMGRPLYEKLGWVASREMRFDLTRPKARARSPREAARR